MGDPFTISRHSVEPARIAEAEHHARGARPHAAKSGRLAPTDRPAPVPRDTSESIEPSSKKTVAAAFNAFQAFQNAKKANQADSRDLKSKAILATAASLQLARSEEKAAKEHARRNKYDLRPDEARAL